MTISTSPSPTRPTARAGLAAGGIAVFRVVVGVMFLTHGTANLFGWPAGGMAPAVGTWPGWYASVLEVAVGAFVIVGLATRIAALVGSGAMAYAYFSVHLADGFWPVTNGAMDAALFAWGFLLLACTGAGLASLDGLIARRRAAAAARARSADGARVEIREPARV